MPSKHRAAITRIEALVVVTLICLGVVLFLFRPRAYESRCGRPSCKDNLAQIGKAIYAYTQNNGGYLPFAWGPADGPQDRPNDAMTSIANLYPNYLYTVKVFRCTSAEDEPHATPNVPDGPGGQDWVSDAKGIWSGQRNWTLHESSYGYDCRVSPKAVSNHAIMADMDGTWQRNKDTMTQNHDGGQNVLYVDGSVRWRQSNHTSSDPADNIYAEDPWHADTDSYISRGGKDALLWKSLWRYPDLMPPKAAE